ncbi:Trehalose-6-P synthase/phosphatase complex subunit [Vermiconidia calcicola]|uniref:Trehalose-6-P synthase/phosphatase complex subunit n=1 Tax=Vermiconidia calcicola TaxID=1690605 RepID=A0ACC3NL78_9PEZI|nr:Trehalose-6-P synthase/phosphatase complex subunit [Vermiconidia calcicola]
MAATHIVSLFLPYTLSFHDVKEDERRRSPSPPRLEKPSIEKRKSLMIDLPSRHSAASLFSGPTPPLTPNTAAEGFFSPSPFATESQPLKRQFSKPGDPRSLARIDADVAEWGRHQVYNQPQSSAKPLPSGSILDFARVHEEIEQQRLQKAKRRLKSSPPSRASRAPSRERGYGSKAWTVEDALQGNGGLTNAVRSAVNSGQIEVQWIGTLGFPTDALPPNTREQIDDHMLNEYQSEIVYVTDKDLDGCYAHYCKTILWPIFHYQVPDHPKSKAYADHSWEFYRNLNQAFADKVVASYKKGDTIWIHDYHLLLVPGMVRKKLPDAQIGFFLHTAFPSSEVFRCLATRKELLEGMLGANLVAFQTEEYSQHFLQTCSRLLTVETTGEGVQLDDHFVNVTSHPIGINPPAIQEAREAEEVKVWIENIQERYKHKYLIVARDKLDGVHGVRQKLLAYELFLNKYPAWAEKTVLIQVATSTSEQSELLTTVSDICSRIDNAHSSLVHQPLVFLKQDIDFSQYLALLTVADVLMVCALRDGMNLTAHEYIFCQDGKASSKKHGPLILSEFTGSAAVFQDHIPINPWDYRKQADAIKTALEMNDAEKQYRYKNLYSRVMNQTGGHWAEELGKSLNKVHEEHNQRSSSAVPRLSTTQISEKYKRANHRVFIIDYEGTLAPHKTREGVPLTSLTRIVDTLNDLMVDGKNIVYVMSGRQPEEIESVFRTATGLGLIAENGCFVREYGAAAHSWETAVDMNEVNRWKKDVKAILRYYRERMEGSYIEERHCSLIFRYERVEDQEAAMRNVGDCADQINSGCKSMRIHAVPIGKAVLIEQVDFSKGTAATNVYNRLCEQNKASELQPPDFLMVVGDDREDEVVFRWANQLAKNGTLSNVFTVSVGKRNTQAQAALTQGSTGLLTVLQKLAKISLDQTPADYFTSPRKYANLVAKRDQAISPL